MRWHRASECRRYKVSEEKSYLDEYEKTRQAAKEANQKHRERQRRVYEAYRQVLGNQESEAIAIVLEDLRNACFVDITTHVEDNQGRVDPIKTAAREGRRQMWNYIRARLVVATDPARLEQHLATIKLYEEED